ncbi:MAG: hypothetical protein ACMG6E_04090 [Candidatus Roizmanbacteria bacterium]
MAEADTYTTYLIEVDEFKGVIKKAPLEFDPETDDPPTEGYWIQVEVDWDRIPEDQRHLFIISGWKKGTKGNITFGQINTKGSDAYRIVRGAYSAMAKHAYAHFQRLHEPARSLDIEPTTSVLYKQNSEVINQLGFFLADEEVGLTGGATILDIMPINEPK